MYYVRAQEVLDLEAFGVWDGWVEDTAFYQEPKVEFSLSLKGEDLIFLKHLKKLMELKLKDNFIWAQYLVVSGALGRPPSGWQRCQCLLSDTASTWLLQSNSECQEVLPAIRSVPSS